MSYLRPLQSLSQPAGKESGKIKGPKSQKEDDKKRTKRVEEKKRNKMELKGIEENCSLREVQLS